MDWPHLSRVAMLSVPDRLSIEIEKLILNGTVKVNSKLPPERELAEMLGVSRVSIRQALHELGARGLIARSPGRGTVVLSATGAAGPSGASIAEALTSEKRDISAVMELRAIIEPPIAGITAVRATARDIAQLRSLLDEMSMDISVVTFAELDRSFHQAIAQYSHNPLLSMLTEQIAALIAPSRKANLQTKRRRQNSIEEHRRILEAIEAHNPEEAERAASSHIASITTEVLRAKEQE